jgi:hypothetical protein
VNSLKCLFTPRFPDTAPHLSLLRDLSNNTQLDGSSIMATSSQSIEGTYVHPSKETWRTSWHLDPTPGHLHVQDLVEAAIDGLYVWDCVSDHVIGMLLLALELKMITKSNVTLFKRAILNHVKFRLDYPHFGRAFLDPDGKFIVAEQHGIKRALTGDPTGVNFGASESTLSIKDLAHSEQFKDWREAVLCTRVGLAYQRKSRYMTHKECVLRDKNELIRYVHGPWSIPPPENVLAIAEAGKRRKLQHMSRILKWSFEKDEWAETDETTKKNGR